jgi:hypothetical protein
VTRKDRGSREKSWLQIEKGHGKGEGSSDSEGLKVNGLRVRKVDSLTRYSIVSRLRAALELGLSRPGSREAAIVLE